MARSRRLKKNGDACYHVMSRTNDRRFLFGKGRFKSRMIGLLKRAAEFSGVKLLAYCMMDDHFHIVCRIVRPEGSVPAGWRDAGGLADAAGGADRGGEGARRI